VVPPAAGPATELARLARPTGPWLHLLDAAPADARQLGWLLGQDGIVVRQLRGHCGRSTYGLLDEIGAALQLPGDPVGDWPSLADLLIDMAWLPGAGHVLVVTRSSLLLAAEPLGELRGLVGAVREVARARAEEGDPVPFHLVLQDDAVGVAALRARLDAVGARYAELAGWDAQEPSVGSTVAVRSVLTGGPADPVDLAAGAAAAAVGGVVSVGRAWEDFRGGSSGPVRVYVPVGAVDPLAAVSAVSAAVAELDASCVVVPVPVDPGAADPRQAAVSAAASAVWPTPERAAPEPAGTGTPAEPPGSPGPDAGTASHGAASPRDQAAPDPAVWDAAGSDPAGLDPAGPDPAGLDSAGSDPAGSDPADLDPAGSDPAGPDLAARPVGEEPAGPRDRPGAPFELIAVDLQWPFDSGSPDNDAVDAALLAHAVGSPLTAALFRTWVADPGGGWVRVVLGYVARGSIADVEAERSALVDTLQAAGAARCCVEALAATDVSDAHRWLEQRCRPLWPAAPADPVVSGPATMALAPDATFRPGPGPDDPQHGEHLRTLLDWAAGRPGVRGVVSAWSGTALVVGVALDAGTDPQAVRRDAPHPVEPFVPAHGLAPVHLRLSRSATRIWTRGPARPAAPEPAATGTLRRPTPPAVTTLGPPPTRDTADARGDQTIDGFTLVGIDRDTGIAKGPPAPDGPDAALIEWARARDGVTALLRGLATVDGEELRVYCVAVAETTDPEGVRRELAVAAGAAGLDRAAAEAFQPAGAISAFHLDVAVGSTRLWPAPR
jgi:hypothetical protein